MKQPAFGNNISTLRNQKGMTQKELADACTIDIRTIQRIEAGEVSPRMHTVRLLAGALGCDTGALTGAPENTPAVPTHQFKLPFLAGIIYTINAIPVVVDLITHSLNAYFHVCVILVHMASCIFFFKGFYLMGRQSNNQVLAGSFLLEMVLLPLVNIIYLQKANYFAFDLMPILFVLLSVNGILCGIGLLIEGNKRKNHNNMNLYKIAGIVMMVQNALFISPGVGMVAAGLIISLLCNIVATTILYMEYTGRG
ncbi:MAG TPA: helix-turn-helix transcriptional regulator, partial [Chitinophagaceae bacterium]|nr:helix-turn-helix transcriptional regulator [Chitinophagaceae bacterium]